MKHEHKLLYLLSLTNHNAAEEAEISSIIRKVKDWKAFYEVAVFNKVVPMCFYTLKLLVLDIYVDRDIWNMIAQDASKIQEQNEARNQEAEVFLKEFYTRKISVALLKGVALGEVVYHNPYYKRMNDIDILVKKDQLTQVYEVYDMLNYFYIGERVSGSKKKSDKVSHLSPPYVSPNFKCVIGTQWGIKTPLSNYRIHYGQVWQRSRPISFRGIPLQVLSPEDNLHHLCLHLGFFKISLRDMMDFYNLLRAYRGTFDWDLFADIVGASKTEYPVYFALSLTQYLHPQAELNTFLKRIEAKVNISCKRAVKWKTRDMVVFLHMHSDHIQTIEKAISEFDATSYFPEKWYFFKKLWGHVWYPEREEMIRMSALYRPSTKELFKARLTIPFKILKVIAGEVGWSLTILLKIKTVIDLSGSLLKFPFVAQEHCDSKAYAERIGVPLDRLIQLKEQFQ